MELRLCRLTVLLGAMNLAFGQIANRIVGGQDGNIEDFPWLVSVQHNSRHACGGALLTNLYVLSAAHCFPREHDIAEYDLVFGTTSLSNVDPTIQTKLVDSVMKSPSYSEDTHAADIALVKLNSPVSFNNNVQPIRLPAWNVQFPAGMNCKIGGWGHVKPSVPLQSPQNLQVGQVKIISRRTCNCLYHINPGPNTLATIQQDMMCAGLTDGSVDACQGDSGGPLVCYTNGNWYQAGVVSLGDECGLENRPGVYVMVSAHINWIMSIVPDAQVNDFTVEGTAEPDNESGCRGANGEVYPYPNSAAVVLVTLGMLPLYWLTAYFLTDL